MARTFCYSCGLYHEQEECYIWNDTITVRENLRNLRVEDHSVYEGYFTDRGLPVLP